MPIIRTCNPSLPVTLRAIAVCAWALAVEFYTALRISSSYLWADYRLARSEARAFNAAHPRKPDPVDEQLAQLDESALESFAREFGRPGWLSATVMALVVSAVVIELLDGWPMLVDAVGTALQLLART